MYVIFEGVDTCGKSTQVKLFSENPFITTTKEPGGTKLGVKLREILLGGEFDLSKNAETFLFLADRAEHYEKVISKNKFVISDRGFISGIAYALANDENVDLKMLLELNKMALGGEFCDKIVFFKTTKELICQRLASKQNDTIEERGIEYLLRVQEAMQRVIDELKIECLVVDCSKSIKDINEEIERFLND